MNIIIVVIVVEWVMGLVAHVDVPIVGRAMLVKIVWLKEKETNTNIRSDLYGEICTAQVHMRAV